MTHAQTISDFLTSNGLSPLLPQPQSITPPYLTLASPISDCSPVSMHGPHGETPYGTCHISDDTLCPKAQLARQAQLMVRKNSAHAWEPSLYNQQI